MAYTVDFKDVSTVGLESSPVVDALQGVGHGEAEDGPDGEEEDAGSDGHAGGTPPRHDDKTSASATSGQGCDGEGGAPSTSKNSSSA